MVAGLTWEAENEAPEGLGVVASILLVTLILVPLCAVFSGDHDKPLDPLLVHIFRLHLAVMHFSANALQV
jgi:hypothetical protein